MVFFYFAMLVTASRSLDLEAVKVAEFCNISRNLLNKIFKEIRNLMLTECEKKCKPSGETQIDESYFLLRNPLDGAKRVRGKRCRGAGNKQPVFDMLKRDGKVYTQIVKTALLVN